MCFTAAGVLAYLLFRLAALAVDMSLPRYAVLRAPGPNKSGLVLGAWGGGKHANEETANGKPPFVKASKQAIYIP